jgi:hypothetical protein
VPRMSSRLALFLLLCSTSAACSGGSSAACQVDEDCASGFCKADGTCGPAEVDGGVDAEIDAVSTICTPNHDGMITLDELPFAAGRMASFRIATDATWDTAGVAMPGGGRRWDLFVQLANDADRDLALGSPTGMWWSAAFQGATYATELASSSDLRGVFELGTTSLDLLGVVSPDGGTYKTELEYDPPAQVLAVPLVVNKTWSTSSTVSGSAQGAIVAYTETYESRVDKVGTMVTPYGEFPVVRVATDMTRTSGFTTLATTRTFTWVAECFGPVATASSQSFESGSEFTDIAEVRRLAP